jgi:ParB/RepB/Spo0J family partition protein
MRIKDTLDDVSVRIAEIYVPAGRRHDVNPDVVAELAESILEDGLKVPISVREGDGRYVLVSGLQRLEACKALGEETITAIIVQARQH